VKQYSFLDLETDSSHLSFSHEESSHLKVINNTMSHQQNNKSGTINKVVIYNVTCF